MKKPDASRIIGAPIVPWDDAWFWGEFPTPSAFLRDTAYDDGSSRATGTVLIFVDNGGLKLCLNDRDNNRSAFIEVSEFMEALAAAESGLKGDTLTWKVRGGYNQSKDKVPF